MHRRLGRNDPCWCGSGRKYKFCHLNPPTPIKLEPWQAQATFREAYSRKTCSAPAQWQGECSEKIVRAHTVMRSHSLKAIARNGHVYSFVPSMEKIGQGNGAIEPELRGINQASTFSGFCSTHDDKIFAPMEKNAFECSDEQCFLVGYRAIARELYTKAASASLNPMLRNSIAAQTNEDWRETLRWMHDVFTIATAKGLDDAQALKLLHDNILVRRSFQETEWYAIEFSVPPDVMCSGGFFPEQDFSGKELQDVADLSGAPEVMSFAAFSQGGTGWVVFSWLPGPHEIGKLFIDSLEQMSDEEIAGALVRLFFEHCENVHLKPEWWEGLADQIRCHLVDRMSISSDFLRGRVEKALVGNGLRCVNWQVVNRRRSANANTV